MYIKDSYSIQFILAALALILVADLIRRAGNRKLRSSRQVVHGPDRVVLQQRGKLLHELAYLPLYVATLLLVLFFVGELPALIALTILVIASVFTLGLFCYSCLRAYRVQKNRQGQTTSP